ncbi:hypothetical protein [Cyclobacterium jeungdonense]|uniref:Short chain amide porin n=1 Tax=Cyclobacterium jeungdonense TaxID=708087 RepID=A0ABT8C5L4_9BACT|nr:hypothetical protein [Cyclobacterium jeungdonense]MDN3687357.1 hypothetical protein [Cyclobacterium jeungdonense]
MRILLFIAVAAFVLNQSQAQDFPLRVYSDKDSSSYAGLRLTGQVWMRYNENNPGTLINGEPATSFFDISVRRLRFQAYARIREKTNLTMTLGQNNINYLSARSGEIRLLDFYVDHRLHRHLTVGGGQSGWNGTSRYAAPLTSKLLTLDISPFLIPTVNQRDNILRKLSAFIAGQAGPWDYRVVFSRPYAPVDKSQIGVDSGFASVKPGIQTAMYLKYQFFDHESLSPFHAGTLGGQKKVLALGLGMERQNEAMWHLNSASDTLTTAITLVAADLFGEIPLSGEKAWTFYLGYFYYDFGPNYLRVIGFNNVGSGLNSQGTFSGTGNAWPAIGTGQSGYFQVGHSWSLPGRNERIQPFISGQYSDYDKLQEPVTFLEAGINLLMDGQRSKLTLAYQNRPVFDVDMSGDLVQQLRKSSLVLQYQVRLE